MFFPIHSAKKEKHDVTYQYLLELRTVLCSYDFFLEFWYYIKL